MAYFLVIADGETLTERFNIRLVFNIKILIY